MKWVFQFEENRGLKAIISHQKAPKYGRKRAFFGAFRPNFGVFGVKK